MASAGTAPTRVGCAAMSGTVGIGGGVSPGFIVEVHWKERSYQDDSNTTTSGIQRKRNVLIRSGTRQSEAIGVAETRPQMKRYYGSLYIR